MSFLRQIQHAAASDDDSVTSLLRKCQILASRLSSHELGEWVTNELNGYSESEAVPKYRTINVESAGNFIDSLGGQMVNKSISVYSLFRDEPEYLNTVRIYRISPSIGSIQDSLNQPTENGRFVRYWPAALVQLKQDEIYRNWSCVEAWQIIPRAALVNVIENARTRILGFVLDMEKENPDAGEAVPGTNPVPAQIVNKVFHLHFYGSVGNAAFDSQNFDQKATDQKQ